MLKTGGLRSPASPRLRPLTIVASGTVFVTHVLTLPSFPGEGTVARARNVTRNRGGSVPNVLSVLGQFANVDALLVAPLAGNSEGEILVRDLQREGVNTRYCRVWEGVSVPSAWILETGVYFLSALFEGGTQNELALSTILRG